MKEKQNQQIPSNYTNWITNGNSKGAFISLLQSDEDQRRLDENARAVGVKEAAEKIAGLDVTAPRIHVIESIIKSVVWAEIAKAEVK